MCEYTLHDGRRLTLRAPEIDDACALIDFHRRVGGETDYLLSDENGIPGLTEEDEKTYLSDTLAMDNTRMWLGFVDGELVCLCDVRAMARPRVAHNGSIGIVVRQDCWHVGVGHILMNEMVDFARRNDTLRRLELTVRADNDRAIALYKAFGFSEYGRAQRYVRVKGTYFDMLQMELLL